MRTMHWVCDGKTKNGAQHERTKWSVIIEIYIEYNTGQNRTKDCHAIAVTDQ